MFEASDLKQRVSNQIDLSNYSKGIYFVRISEGEKVRTEKIVMQ